MILQWAPIPLIRIAVFFGAGILLGIYQFERFPVFIVLWTGGIACVGFAASYLIQNDFRKYAAGAFAFLVIFSAGYVVVHIRTLSVQSNNLIHVKEEIVAYRGVIRDHVYERKNSYKTLVEVDWVKTNKGWLQTTGKVNLYLAKKTFEPTHLQWGNHVLVMGGPNELLPPANPHEFDFKRFLTFKNTYHQHFIQGTDVVRLGETDDDILHYSARARRYFSDIILRYVTGAQEQAIALALVIGVTDGVDNELENAYSASGAMHVLAVSGLHISILYSIILFFLKPLDRLKHASILIAAISLMLLWGYSFVTGLSPSVLRAVTMFSFVAVAKIWSARANIFNTLAGSAIILLLIDPYLIMSVGFQLSYLAVLGIIWIQRPLYLLWEAKTLLMDKVWQITCVSIAAQLTTFSLGLLYFHQFPTYFLVSNLFVIPISFVVLVVGIALLAVSFVAPLAKLVGYLLWGSVKLLNSGVLLVEELPYSIVNNIYVDVFQSWLIMGLVTALIFVWQRKAIQWLYVAFAFSIVLTGARWWHQAGVLNESKFVVYNVKGASVIEFMEDGLSYIMADSALLVDAERVRFHIRPNRLYNLVNKSIDEVYDRDKPELNRLIKFWNTQVAIINQPIVNPKLIHVPLAVVSSKAAWSVPKLLKAWPETHFVLDATWSDGQLRWLLRQQIEEFRLYSVGRQGAYVYSLPQ